MNSAPAVAGRCRRSFSAARAVYEAFAISSARFRTAKSIMASRSFGRPVTALAELREAVAAA
jgi:hypothetical protein